MEYSKKLWLWLGGIFILSFAVLGLIGREIYVEAPPVPEKVVTASILDAMMPRIASTASAPTCSARPGGMNGPSQIATRAVAMPTAQ